MWPAMIDEPTWPGRGLPVYQPATAAVDGTCNVCCAVSPSLTRLLLTPLAGISSQYGLATRLCFWRLEGPEIRPTGPGAPEAKFLPPREPSWEALWLATR